MHAVSSPGDALPRALRDMKDELKKLQIMYAQLARRCTALEQRVYELENP